MAVSLEKKTVTLELTEAQVKTLVGALDDALYYRLGDNELHCKCGECDELDPDDRDLAVSYVRLMSAMGL